MTHSQAKVPGLRLVGALLLTMLTACLGACATSEPTTVSVAELLQRPAEHALANGLRSYEEGAFDAADHSLHDAISKGLRDPRDIAVARKYLAFIACAFNRLSECEANFRAAFTADPNFQLSAAEIGHPIWGPVYRQVYASVHGTQKAN